MKILSLHCDYIRFKPLKKAISKPEELSEEAKKEIEVKEPLGIFVAVEKSDEGNLKKAIDQLVDNVLDLKDKVKGERVVLYPYAHLSANLSNPAYAQDVLQGAEVLLKKKKIEVFRAPFGYYKSFELKCKGHPLAELSRSFGLEIDIVEKDKFIKLDDNPKEVVKEKKKSQREIISEQIETKHYLLTPEGKEYKIDPKNEDEIKKALKEINNEDFSMYVLFNEIKNLPKKEPPSIKEMQQQELIGYAPEADTGHFKFYPKGNLIFELLKEWAYEIAVNRFNCLQIETPVIYDWSDEEIREQGGSFHERHYTVHASEDPEKEWVMRFAGDFGLFKIMKAANFSYRNLPIRMYEFSKSFRYEQKGELSGLKRLRGFHMPDIHSFTKDLEAGWQEYKELYKQYDDLAKGTGIKYAVVFRVVEEFYDKYKDQIIEMLKYSKAPAYIETLSGMKHYWAVKHEFQGIDSVKGSTQLSTVQLDVKDAETYGILYKDTDNKKKGCTIVHSSVGSIERWIYCILENAFKMKKPQWPFWLSPTQIRICPVSEKFIDKATEIANQLNKARIRTDVDDRDNPLPKKVSNAESEWTPYILVLGEREITSGKLAIRTRETGKIENLSIEELIKKMKEEQGEMPWKPLAMQVLLTKRPIFVG
jgi:threonyl-tRNA synthetase